MFKRRKKTRYPTYSPKRQPRLESTGSKKRASERAPRKRRKSGGGDGFKSFLIRAAWIGAGIGAIFLGIIYLTLPDINDLNSFTKKPSILIKSEDGQIIGSFGDVYGDYLSFHALPRSLTDAVIATEDRNFYHHFGIDPFGLLRAAFVNLRARHVVQGGSTITQQVAKNVFLTPERSFIRKIREMMLAIKLERRFSKQDILCIYLNRVYLGAGTYGVDAAAKRYFDKSARDLTLPESAIMAGLLKAPSRYAPTANPKLSRERADQVLLNMEDAKYLTKSQTEKAQAELSKSMSARKKNARSTLYFADWVADQLPEYVGNVDDDIVVTTTLRPQWQAFAEKAINDVMDKEGEKHDASQAALLSMTPDGAIRVMIGGRDYAESQYNRATQALRQPGSSFKIFVYLAGLESGLTPSSMVEDKPITLPISGGHWQPHNYNGRYLGTMTLKDAVTESVNTVAVQVSQRAGLSNVISMARRLGITSELEAVPSIALGSTEVNLLEMTTAYAHLAANGAMVLPYGIVEIDTSRGEPLYRRQSSQEGAVLRSDIVGEMNEMLESVVEHGTGKGAQIGRPVAGKTGTTSDYKDAWFIGFTPDVVTGVWVGNDDNEPMKKVTGGMLPAMIWRDYMAAATAGMKVRDIYTGGFFSGLSRAFDSDDTSSSPQQQREQGGANNHRPRDVNLGPSFWDKLMR